MEARVRALSESGAAEGVGRLSEKTLHKTLKYYLEPNEAYHEVKLLGSIADIKNERGVFEIQTRFAYKLRAKIIKLLEIVPVTLVLPLAVSKTVAWISRETGEISKPRKSPRAEGIYDALFELYELYDLFDNKGFSVKLICVDASEYRYLGKDGAKRGTERLERIANSLKDEIDIREGKDIIPYISDIPEKFTAKELSRITKRSGRRHFYILKTLERLGLIQNIGNRGRAFVYKRCF